MPARFPDLSGFKIVSAKEDVSPSTLRLPARLRRRDAAGLDVLGVAGVDVGKRIITLEPICREDSKLDDWLLGNCGQLAAEVSLSVCTEDDIDSRFQSYQAKGLRWICEQVLEAIKFLHACHLTHG